MTTTRRSNPRRVPQPAPSRLPVQILDELLTRQLAKPELRLRFDERRFYLHVAHLLGDLRAKAGLTQAEVAQRASVSQPIIARLETGDHRRTPTFDMIYKVLQALGFTLDLAITPTRPHAA